LLRCEEDILFGEAAWRDTTLEVSSHEFTNLFAAGEVAQEAITVGRLLSEFPVAVLISPALAKGFVRSENAALQTHCR
jgi:maltooligosyltrehalose synthase